MELSVFGLKKVKVALEQQSPVYSRVEENLNLVLCLVMEV